MKVTCDSSIEELLAASPSLAAVFVRLGLPCFECGEPSRGSIEELCVRYGRDGGEVLGVINDELGRMRQET